MTYTSYDSDNIFAKMLNGDVPVEKLLDNDACIAINDINPARKTHILFIPKVKATSFDDFIIKAPAHLVKGLFVSIKELATELGLDESGYRIITNHGADAHQTVPHFHIHLLGGEPIGPLVAGSADLR